MKNTTSETKRIDWMITLVPLLLIGLLLRIPLVKFNRWYVAKVESTKVVA